MKKLLSIILPVVLFSCAGSVIKLMPEYASVSFDQDNLGVVFVREHLMIENSNDLFDDLGAGDPKEVFYEFFKENFTASAKTHGRFKEVQWMEIAAADIQYQSLPLKGSETIDAATLKSGAQEGVRYYLCIDYLSTSRKKTAGTPGMFRSAGPGKAPVFVGGSSGTDDLLHNSSFSIWDNQNKKIVAYGKLQCNQGVFVAMTKNTWSQIEDQMAYKIFYGKPYGR